MRYDCEPPSFRLPVLPRTAPRDGVPDSPLSTRIERAARLTSCMRAVEFLACTEFGSQEAVGIVNGAARADHGALRTAQRAARGLKGGARASQRQVEVGQCLTQIIADRLRGISLTSLMMLLDLCLKRLQFPRNGRQSGRGLRPIHLTGGAPGKKSRSYVYGSGQQAPGPQLRPHTVGNQQSIIFLRSGSISTPGPQVEILYAKSLGVQLDCHWSRKLERWRRFPRQCP